MSTATIVSEPDQDTLPPVAVEALDEINGNWDDVRTQLDTQLRDGLDTDALQRAIEANSRSAQLALFGGTVQYDDAPDNRSMTSARTRGGTVARAFWWGFHIQISHADVQMIINGMNGAGALIDALTPLVPPVIRPFLAVVKIFLDVSAAVLRALDRGRGVYISMSWFAPAVFVPTSV